MRGTMHGFHVNIPAAHAWTPCRPRRPWCPLKLDTVRFCHKTLQSVMSFLVLQASRVWRMTTMLGEQVPLHQKETLQRHTQRMRSSKRQDSSSLLLG